MPNGEPRYYVETLKRLREAVRRKRGELWPKNLFGHHDNVPDRTLLSVKQFVAKYQLLDWQTSLFTRFDFPMTFGSFRN
jgi:hypothetical protein